MFSSSLISSVLLLAGAAAASAMPDAGSGSASCPSVLPLQNPGFESGSLAPWKPVFDDYGAGGGENASASLKSPGLSGQYLLRVEWTRFVYGVFNLTQSVGGLCAGKTYNVSFDFQFHNWDLAYHPDECANTVQLGGAKALETTQFGPFNNGTWYRFNRSFKAHASGATNLTVTTTCATEPDEDSGPAWAAWYDDFAIKLAD